MSPKPGYRSCSQVAQDLAAQSRAAAERSTSEGRHAQAAIEHAQADIAEKIAIILEGRGEGDTTVQHRMIQCPWCAKDFPAA